MKTCECLTCPMCGRDSKYLVNRWYQYDNGQRFIAYVCKKCAKLHDKLQAQKVRSV